MNTGIHKIWFHITEKGSVYFIMENIEVTSVYIIIPRLNKPIKRGKIKKAIKKKDFGLFTSHVAVNLDGWIYKEMEL